MNEPTSNVSSHAAVRCCECPNALCHFGTDSARTRRQILFDKECKLFNDAVNW